MAVPHSLARWQPVAVLLLFCCAASCTPAPQNLGGLLTNQGASQGAKSGEGQFQRRLVVRNDKKAMTTRIEDSYVIRDLDGDILMQQGAGLVGTDAATGDLFNTAFDADRGPRNEQLSEEEEAREAEVMTRSARQRESVDLNFKHGGGGRRPSNDYSEDTGTGSGPTRDNGTGSGATRNTGTGSVATRDTGTISGTATGTGTGTNTDTGTGTGTGTGSGTAPSRRRRPPSPTRRDNPSEGRGGDGTQLKFSFNKGRSIAADEGDYVDPAEDEDTPAVKQVSRGVGVRSLFGRSHDLKSQIDYDSTEDAQRSGKARQELTGIAILEPTKHGKSFQVRRVGWSRALGVDNDGMHKDITGKVRQGRKLSESRSSMQFKSANGNQRSSSKPSFSSRFLRSI